MSTDSGHKKIIVRTEYQILSFLMFSSIILSATCTWSSMQKWSAYNMLDWAWAGGKINENFTKNKLPYFARGPS